MEHWIKVGMATALSLVLVSGVVYIFVRLPDWAAAAFCAVVLAILIAAAWHKILD